MSPPISKTTFASLVKSGDRKALAQAITLVENDLEGAGEFLLQLEPRDVPVLGFTGPPGAGKSTLINSLLRRLTAEGKKVAVIAVDPTSPFNFGSLLADRIRMTEHFTNERVFIRSLATRGSLGGLSEKIIEITDVLRSSGFDYIIIETVGVGQSEVEVAGLADTTIVVVVPESGDEIQLMKSGILEIADIFLVNKADRPGADLLSNSLSKMLHGRKDAGWNIPVIRTIATEDKGIDELVASIEKHGSSPHQKSKKIFLMTEKAYQLIRNRRMKSLRREDVRQKIETAIQQASFNLYRFVEKLVSC